MPRNFTTHRVNAFTTTIFSEITALANQYGAINLGQGFPDFDGPEEIKQCASDAVLKNYNQYAPSHGMQDLREAIAEHSERFYSLKIDPAMEITVTSGATEALFDAAFAFIQPGDEVIVFEPCYDSYIPAIEMAGGIVKPVTLHAPDFRFKKEELCAAFSEKTKAIYVNTPHNPTGTVFEQGELELIAELCDQFDVLAITDEVYEHIVFSGTEHLRLASFKNMRERTLTISSIGKSFSLTGWKIGWAIGAPELITALKRVHQFATFSTATAFQVASARALRMPHKYFTFLKEDFGKRRDFLFNILKNIGFEPVLPQGSYFILCNIRNFPFKNGLEFSRNLIEHAGVASIPLQTMYVHPEFGKNLVRFCFCKKWETLQEAALRLQKIYEPVF
ncbi:MAG TPA: methionine aminotransferase [Patescibacteria group bacterium]|nr:methionine aminotransferase [Patescibacteria group bacterium]